MRGLLIEVAYSDDDLIDLLFKVSNGAFLANLTVETSVDELHRLASFFNELMSSEASENKFALHSYALETHIPFSINLSCRDSLGHMHAAVSVSAMKMDECAHTDSAVIHFSTTYSDIDSFLSELKLMIKNSAGSAYLSANS